MEGNMMNYPYNKPASMNPYGYPGVGMPQAGGQQGMYPMQAGGQMPQIPAGSMIPGAGFPGAAMPGGMGMQPEDMTPGATMPGQLPLEQSYIENILRLNLGKIATIYMTFENNREWNAKIFKGRLEAAGRDHIIISDPQTGMRYLLLMVNLDYITFDEELNYFPPGHPGAGTNGR
jgi:spore germination protein Q